MFVIMENCGPSDISFLPLNKRSSFADGCGPRKGPGRWEEVPPPPHFKPLTHIRLYFPGHRYCSGN